MLIREIILLFHLIIFISLFSGCAKNDRDIPDIPADTSHDGDTNYDPRISDTYDQISDITYSALWGPYNLHDPSIIKYGEYYYIYSTDVAYGDNLRCGIMVRKSKDLVHWTFMGWVFNGIPAIPLQFMTTNQPGYQQLSLWAPCIIKAGDRLRLYYSVPGNNGLKLACIGLATSDAPEGPWTDEGIVLSCYPDDPYNAIDPSVIIDGQNGRHWMSYGSYEEGIYMVELDPLTGKRLNAGDLGHRVAYRTERHDAIEGSEIFYSPDQNMYYLFVSYDWLEDNYNVRVGRSEKPEGPYYDIRGADMAGVGDNYPMITARYRFSNHSGWQGVGHNTAIAEGDSAFFISQGRLGSNKYFMDLHARRMVFTPDGWPAVSPERYAAVPQNTITASDLTGPWEHIELLSTGSMNTSVSIRLMADGSVSGMENSTWNYEQGVLTLSFSNNQEVFRARVFREWDWENKKLTIVYTGLTAEGLTCWGKKTST